jgi:imidazolonepropionase-like amidohydrolase
MMRSVLLPLALFSCASPGGATSPTASATVGDLAVRAGRLHTMSGPVLEDAVVIVRGGKITAIGPAASTPVPDGLRLLEVPVVTPGLVDAHTVVGLAGHLNQDHDQDQLERSDSLQPELRALDAYNARERLISWVRSFGVTTMHTGHGPGAVISGETLIVKTRGDTVDEAVLVPRAMIAATLGESALRENGKSSPGTRGKAVAMLRDLLVKGKDYQRKREAPDSEEPLDLRLEAVARLLRRELPLLVTCQRHQDILSALRISREFDLRLVIDGAADAQLVLEELVAARVPVIVHPTMQRAAGESENLSMETAGKLDAAGVTIALQSGYESYVPKTRVVLFEAAIAASNGLAHERALRSITLGAAELLGVAERVGSLELGKDGDMAFYDGDPFEFTTHCLGVVIEGEVVSEERR